MFKLLTENVKRKTASEYIRRRVAVILLGLIIVLVIAVIGVLPSYVLTVARQNDVLGRTRIVNSAGLGEDENHLKEWLSGLNRKLQILSPALDIDRPSEFIRKTLERKTAGVDLISFSWTKEEDKTILLVSGKALDRQTLIMFEDSINVSGYFSEVTLPISDLAKNKNIDFQMKFSPL